MLDNKNTGNASYFDTPVVKLYKNNANHMVTSKANANSMKNKQKSNQEAATAATNPTTTAATARATTAAQRH